MGSDTVALFAGMQLQLLGGQGRQVLLLCGCTLSRPGASLTAANLAHNGHHLPGVDLKLGHLEGEVLGVAIVQLAILLHSRQHAKCSSRCAAAGVDHGLLQVHGCMQLPAVQPAAHMQRCLMQKFSLLPAPGEHAYGSC